MSTWIWQMCVKVLIWGRKLKDKKWHFFAQNLAPLDEHIGAKKASRFTKHIFFPPASKTRLFLMQFSKGKLKYCLYCSKHLQYTNSFFLLRVDQTRNILDELSGVHRNKRRRRAPEWDDIDVCPSFSRNKNNAVLVHAIKRIVIYLVLVLTSNLGGDSCFFFHPLRF